MAVEAAGSVGRGGVAAGGLGWSKGVWGWDRVACGWKMYVEGWFVRIVRGWSGVVGFDSVKDGRLVSRQSVPYAASLGAIDRRHRRPRPIALALLAVWARVWRIGDKRLTVRFNSLSSSPIWRLG